MRVISTDCGVSKCMHFVIFSIKSMRLAEKSKKVRERENNGRNKVTYRQNCRQPVFDVCKASTRVFKTNIECYIRKVVNI